MPTTDTDPAPNAFESGTANTAARSGAEQAIEELRERGGFFVEAVRSTRTPMVLTDPNLPGNPIIFANQSFLEFSGYAMDEVLGQQPYFMNGPDTDPADAARFRKALNEDHDIVLETIQYTKDGSRLMTALFLSAFKDRDGRTIHHFMSWFDVSDRVSVEQEIGAMRQLQATLSEREEQLRVIVESARDYAIFTTDPDGVIDRWMPGAEQVFGWTREEAEGQPCAIVFTGQDRATGEPEKEIETARREGKAADVRWHLRKDGRLVFIEGQVVPMRSDDGRIRGFLKIGQDVTDRRLRDQALRDSEERFRGFGEASSDVLWIRDATTLQWEYLSPAFEAIYGVSVAEALKAENYGNWLDLIVEEDRDHAKASIERVRTGERVTFEYRIRRPDGEVRWMRDTDFAMVGPDGAIVRFGGVGQDVTDIKRAEAQQTMLLAELQHRVRNTLAVVRSIARRTAENSDSVDNMLAHFQGRLDAFSRVQAAITRSHEAAVDLRSLIQDELVAHAAREDSQVHIAGADIAVSAQTAERLSLAIHELTTNAVKHGALINGGGQIRIRWDKENGADGERLKFRWIESGVRIDKDDRLREGFGMELLRRSLPYDLQGETKVEVTPTGLQFELSMPLVNGESMGSAYPGFDTGRLTVARSPEQP